MKTTEMSGAPKGAPEGSHGTASAGPGADFLSKFSPGVRKLLASTPEAEWPHIRAFLIESEEEGELLDLVPGVNRVMKYCPPMMMGRVGKREIEPDMLDLAYGLFHESIHGLRSAVFALLDLAGCRDYRSLAGPAVPRPRSSPRNSQPPPAGGRTSPAP